MAVRMKVLWQENPSAAGYKEYTVPSDMEVQGTLHICNQSSTPATIRVAIIATSGTPLKKEYIIYDAQVDQDDPLEKPDILMRNGDENYILYVYASTADVSFTLSGMERDV